MFHNLEENDLLAFQSVIGSNYELASKKFKSAISEIDNAILRLQKVKAELEGSEKNLRIADDKANDLSVKKLTRKNPTMKKLFDDLDRGNEKG